MERPDLVSSLTQMIRPQILLLILAFLPLISCNEGRIRLGQCCRAGLIDTGKLLKPNLPGAAPGHMTLTREFNAADDFDLNQLLLKPGGESVIWSVNDRDINGSVLRLRSAPREDHVAVYQVRVRHRDSQEADEFSLISFPLGTRMRFASWYDREMTDLSWLSLLPPVYSSLSPGFSNPEPKDCTKHFWQDVHPLHSNFHPGAAYEMRSRAVGGGSGHQAVYDSSGNLIRTGAGAGSADKGAPILGTLGPFRHRDRDVLPFVWAVQLDGNPVNPTWLSRNLDVPLIRYGEHMMQYQSVRPALWGPRPEIPPGICISTTQ